MRARDAKHADSSPCTARSERDPGTDDTGSVNRTRTERFLAIAAECGVPDSAARALRERLRSTAAEIRERTITPAGGLRRAVRLAVAVSMLLKGRGTGPEARS